MGADASEEARIERMASTALRSALADLIRDDVKRAIEEAKAKLDEQLPQLVAGVALQLMGRVNVELEREELVLRVELNLSGRAKPEGSGS